MRLKLAVLRPERKAELSQEGGRRLVRFPLDLDVVNDWHAWSDRFRLGYVVPWDTNELPLTLKSRIALREGEGAKHLPVDLSIGPYDVLRHQFAIWYPRYTHTGTFQAAVYLTDGEHVRWHRLKLEYQCTDDFNGTVTSSVVEAEGRLPVAFTER